jgi:hypothetical protein
VRPRGATVIIVVIAFSVIFAVAVALVGQGLRQDYRVPSRGDTERTDVDLTDARVVWVERVSGSASPGAVVSYDIATRARTTLEADGASMEFPILADEDWAAWVVGSGPHLVRVHDFRANRTSTLGHAGDDVWLPGRTLGDGQLLIAGTMAGARGVWRVVLATEESAPLKLVSEARVLDGSTLAWDAASPPSPLAFAGGKAWWWSNATIAGYDLEAGLGLAPFDVGGPVVGLDADRAALAWDEDHGRVRRVGFMSLANGTRGEVSAFPYDQHGAAVNGTRVAFVQHDGLVRVKDLVTQEERVLPARTQENLHIRLAPSWAAWLSGTIEGHNVVLTPLH